MKVNEDKTKVMVISSSNRDGAWDPMFHAGDQEVDLVKDHRFLGVKVDNSLRFTTHVSTVADTGRKRVNIIRCLSSKDWGNTLETQRSLYIQYIRAVLEYA